MLDISDKISNLRKLPLFGNYLAIALENTVDAVNNLGRNIAADPTQTMPPPPPLQALNIKASGGGVHVTLTDNSEMQRGKQYFVEYDTNPNFTQPHVEDLGASRGKFLNLPGMDDNGNPQSFYFRAYAQYHGSDPSKHVIFGAPGFPTAVQPGGSQMLTLLPSTGSGTAAANGQQGGQGLGRTLIRTSTLRSNKSA